MSDIVTTRTEKFVSAFQSLCMKTIVSSKEPADVFKEALKKVDLHFGLYHGMADCYISPDGKVPQNLKMRFIVTETDIASPDWIHISDSGFEPFGLRLFKRRDLIRVVCIAPDSKQNAVFYYRVELPALKLWENYVDLHVSVVTGYSIKDIDLADIVCFHRYFPKQLGVVKYAKSKGKKVVFDIDDLELCINPGNPVHSYYARTNVQEELKELFAYVDLVTTTTETLKKELSIFHNRIEVLRNKIDLKLPNWNVPAVPHEGVHIGWAGGLTHKDDLQLVESSLVSICRKFPQVKFFLCGYTRGGKKITLDDSGKIVKTENVDRTVWDEILDRFAVLGSQLVVREGTTIQEYPKFFSEFDIVLAPLANNRFNRSKSELKAVEAGVRGLPIVCSDVDPYRVLKPEEGFLASSPRRFDKYLSRLIQNETLRKVMGTNLQKKVRTMYDAQDQKDRYKLYRDLIRN